MINETILEREDDPNGFNGILEANYDAILFVEVSIGGTGKKFKLFTGEQKTGTRRTEQTTDLGE